MDAVLHQQFKSLSPFSIINLPDFVVLTGLNGAGKTQLLEGISSDKVKLIEGGNVNPFPRIYVRNGDLTPKDSPALTTTELITARLHEFEQYKIFRTATSDNLTNSMHHPEIDEWLPLYSGIALISGKNINKLSQDDFLRHYPLNYISKNRNLFGENFTNLFKSYQDRLNDNAYLGYLNKEYGQQNDYLTDSKFRELYGDAPWNTVNQILKAANLDYEVNNPSKLHPGGAYELKLISITYGSEVNISELSSGEKVLMSFAYVLYNSQDEIKFPKVILFDEPDASLHPLMAKQLIAVITQVLVKDKGVKVIMTTHSPSTVAFAPEDSLFVVNKTGVKIQKATKDQALRALHLVYRPSVSIMRIDVRYLLKALMM